MKKLLVLAVAAIAVSIATGASAQQKGGAEAALPVLVGGQGVLSPDGKVRYVALTTGRQTIVSFIRARGGQIVRWQHVRGYFGVPVVSLDGTTDGVSRDGRTLVLAGMPEGRADGSIGTQFAIVDTKTLKVRRTVLPGTWSYDAISPDGSLLYLIEYAQLGSHPVYTVRAYDMAARRLLARPVVDSEIGLRLMRGWAVTRATSADGRWAYTLYARAKQEPFVHALDTASRRAYCINLPLDLGRPEQMKLRLRLLGGQLEIRSGRATVAAVDTRSFVVQRR